MYYFWMLVLLSAMPLTADQIKAQTIACPTVEMLKSMPQETENDFVKLNLFAMQNNCEILTKEDGIEAVDYDPANEKALYIKIFSKRTAKTLYVLRRAVLVEQPGKKNRFRF
ncbi:MAG: hypothetical protein B5M52_00320 [Helicobacteraceae bacterium 4484_230]|nr:MAG: hypothetical protein B5M52_00320 [Helicobacteraceae bacterium 4484_230]